MEKNWYIVNKRLLEMERVPKEAWSDEWMEEWNSLIDYSQTIAGCIKREKYGQKTGEKAPKEGRDRIDVQSVSGCVAEEGTLFGSVEEVVGEGSPVGLLSSHPTQE